MSEKQSRKIFLKTINELYKTVFDKIEEMDEMNNKRLDAILEEATENNWTEDDLQLKIINNLQIHTEQTLNILRLLKSLPPDVREELKRIKNKTFE